MRGVAGQLDLMLAREGARPRGRPPEKVSQPLRTDRSSSHLVFDALQLAHASLTRICTLGANKGRCLGAWSCDCGRKESGLDEPLPLPPDEHDDELLTPPDPTRSVTVPLSHEAAAAAAACAW